MKTTQILFALLAVAAVSGVMAHADPGAADNRPTPTGVTANTPQEIAMLHQEDLLNAAGEEALRAGRYADAEKDYRTIQAIDSLDAGAYKGLGEAWSGQGRLVEAVQAYRTLIFQDLYKWSSIAQDVRTQMHYAALLSRTGQWVEAVTVYEKTLPETADFGGVRITEVHFDPRVPQPEELAATAYIASGLDYFGGGEKKDAFGEFRKAFQMAPDSALTNYYYGFGWRSLDPKDQAKFGSEQEAKAALQKAVKLGKGAVKQAAQKALLVATKTK